MVDRGVGEAGVACRRSDRNADQAAGNVAPLLCNLVGVREMGLPVAPDARRPQRQFPCLDQCAVHGHRGIDTPSPIFEWSRKLLTRFWKVSASSSHPFNGICTPNWCSSSRSPRSGTKLVLLALA